MYLFEWDLYQWAEAGQRFADKNGYLPMPCLCGAIVVKDSWRRSRSDEPTGKAIIVGVEKPLATGWAARTFLKSAVECYEPPLPRPLLQ